MNKNIEQLQKMIAESSRIVFFGGAGTSTDCGLKDFRSVDGIYNHKNIKYQPEYMLSSRCFYEEPEEFYQFYKTYLNSLDIQPNITYKYLKKLEDIGKLKAIITQNIDGLHKKAGNKNVYEIHGTIYQNNCMKCGKEYTAKDVFQREGVPLCDCGGMIKPNVVLYGEMLPEQEYHQALMAIYQADMLVVAGTSLTVYPANEMITLFRGKYLVIINKDETTYDERASLVIHENLSFVCKELMKNINQKRK